ncbi:MAG: DUF1349 domain-containing protein [Chloroflexota bacterium]|nr:DUF1349 domain-containing protein [Chloroflexota bacterium]
MKFEFLSETLPDAFRWLNEPLAYSTGQGLTLMTRPETDFWQGTHYGFRRDNGHCLLTSIQGDFTLETRTEFAPVAQYDQCGLMVRVDSANWIKCSLEYENSSLSRLGSVVTNGGFSDWATQDITTPVYTISYRISKSGQDFLIEYSWDGESWYQMRITHLANCPESLDAGLYACSPVGEGFQCTFEYLATGENQWDT